MSDYLNCDGLYEIRCEQTEDVLMSSLYASTRSPINFDNDSILDDLFNDDGKIFTDEEIPF